MLPTMYLPGVLVVTLFAAVFADGDDLKPQGTDQGSTGTGSSQSTALVPLSGPNDSPPLSMSEFCFLGKFPSATCRFRCHMVNMEAYCLEVQQPQSGEGKCLCRPSEIKPETPQETQDLFKKPEPHKEQEADKTKKPEEGESTSEEDSSSQEASLTIPMHTAPEEAEEEEPKNHVVFYIFDLNKVFAPQTNATKETQTEIPEPQAVPAGWTVQHFIAILIILLLLVLITIELFACYKKQQAKNNDMETIFKNIPMPNKS